MSTTRLLQEGYMCVATFNRKEQADARASFHKEQGHDTKITKKTDSFGLSLYSVFIKMKEV